MMKRLLFLVYVMLIGVAASAQEFTLEYEPGYGTYNMSSMKDHLKQMLQTNALKGQKTTDNFSGYLTHDLRMGCLINRHHFGVLFSHMNTAGQNHLADYSGEYKYRIRVYGNKLGAFYRFALSRPSAFTPFIELSTGAVFSTSTIDLSMRLEGVQKEEEQAKLKGTNLFVQPALGLSYRFCNFAGALISVGYEWNPVTNMSLEGNKSTIDADWSGVRISVGIITYFKTK